MSYKIVLLIYGISAIHNLRKKGLKVLLQIINPEADFKQKKTIQEGISDGFSKSWGDLKRGN